MDGSHNHHCPPYGMADFRQLISGFPAHSSELFSSHHQGPQLMDMIMATSTGQHVKVHGGATSGLYELPADHSPRAAAAPFDGGDGGSARWPRQETLTLLEIRSRLDSRFREANQKGPLWEEISRIMSEEHGYQRTGKKCREKFENLYKYYKKTKEGKASRQDGKHYRFFRQLEALYGDHKGSNAPAIAYNSVTESQGLINSIGLYQPAMASPQLMNATNNHETTTSHQYRKISGSLSMSGSLDFNTCYSSEDNNNIMACRRDHLMVGSMSIGHSYERAKKRRGGRSWKAKIKEFIDSRTRKMIEKQEAWAEKMMRDMDGKEQERLARDEEWRRQEIARIDKEHKFWAKERAWIEARDAAIMETLRNLTSRSSSSDNMILINDINMGTAIDSAKLGDVSSKGDFLKKSKDYYDKKRKEDIPSCDGNNYYPVENESVYGRGEVVAYNCVMANVQGAGAVEGAHHHQLNTGSSLMNLNAGIPIQDSCLQFLMSEGGSLWENYAMKLNKGEN